MKKLFLSILVICSLLGGNAYSEVVYLKCVRADQTENNVVEILTSEYLFDNKKITLQRQKSDKVYEIKQLDGTIKKQRASFYPMIYKNARPSTKFKVDGTHYQFAGATFLANDKSYDEIIKHNKNNEEKIQYTITKLNKYTLEMVHISYVHVNQWSTDINKINKKILVQEESKLPKKCSILKSQL